MALFPTLVFRRAYEALQSTYPGTSGDAHYLRLLHLAASTQETEVHTALELLLDAAEVPEVERVKVILKGSDPFLTPNRNDGAPGNVGLASPHRPRC